MRDIRKLLCWIFAFTCALYTSISIRGVLYVTHHGYWHLFFWYVISIVAFPVFTAIVSGLAWWRVWTASPSARIWALVASDVYIIVSLWKIILNHRSISYHSSDLLAGIVGIVVFAWHYEQPYSRGLAEHSNDQSK